MSALSGSHDGAVPTALPALLLLADGRFPAGGHAHSGGVEAAIGCGDVRDVTTLEEFLRGRLATAGLVASAFAAAACAAVRQIDSARPADNDNVGCPRRSGAATSSIERLDTELDARIPSPALRTASRRLGRQLLRAGRDVWPHPALAVLSAASGHGLHHAVALGAVAAAARLDPGAAALAAAHDAVMGPATAAVRLLGLDPFAVHAALARLAAQMQAVAADGAEYADTAPADLPACSGPLLDVRAEHHASWEVRLFAS